MKTSCFATKNITTKTLPILLSAVLWASCQSGHSQLKQDPDTTPLEITASTKPALEMKPNQQSFLLKYQIHNKGKKDIYEIKGTIFFLDGDTKIQEIGPLSLYQAKEPLKPNYKYSNSKLLTTKPFPWKGENILIQIHSTKNRPPK